MIYMKKILVTGSAGFIGFHLVSRLINKNFEVYGLDSINDYYDINLKYSRLRQHGITKEKIRNNKLIHSDKFKNYFFVKADLCDSDFLSGFFKKNNFDYVINLAAQAGVRFSIENPNEYIKSNIIGFTNLIECCRYNEIKHLIYASTSSVYGLNSKMPLKEDMPTEHPMAFYAASKKSNEMIAHSYSHLFNLPTSGLRFFTVYGPWGRPDMALFLFTEAILKSKPLNIYNFGKMIRDFTYVDDIVESIVRLMVKPPSKNKNWNSNIPRIDTSSAPYRIFNIGNGSPVKLMDYIEALEDSLNIKGEYNMMKIQPGDVPATHADTSSLDEYIGFRPNTSTKEGVKRFVKWYKSYYDY